MHVPHVFDVIKATNALFWRILFKALNHLEYAYPCLLLDAQSTPYSYSILNFTESFGKLSQATATAKWRIHLSRAGFINWGHSDVKRAEQPPDNGIRSRTDHVQVKW